MGRKIGAVIVGIVSLVLIVILFIALRVSGHEITGKDVLTVLSGGVLCYCFCMRKFEAWYYIITNSYRFFRPERLLKIALFAIVSAIGVIVFLWFAHAEIKSSIILGVCIFAYLNHIHLLSGIIDDLSTDDSNDDALVYARTLGGRGLDIFLSPLPNCFILFLIFKTILL